MAGHSQFKNIMHRKGAQDSKRGKLFTKIIREITVAVKESGSDPHSNARLRSAMISARSANMPRDNIDRAIKRGEGSEDLGHYDEVRYEGYGPGGVAVIVEALTDNRNRTASEIRAAFNKYQGSLGETNSVGFMFDRIGIITYPKEAVLEERLFEVAADCLADNVETFDLEHEVTTSVENFVLVRDHLIQTLGDPSSARLIWRPQTTVKLEGAVAACFLKLIDVLEDNDDVQAVFSNVDVPGLMVEEAAL